MGNSVTGRLAPSPTGAQHVGNARTYLAAWLSARSLGGRVLLRIEDVDSPRVKKGADLQAIDDLPVAGIDFQLDFVQCQALGRYHPDRRQRDRWSAWRHDCFRKRRKDERIDMR